jgi:hypothetical protein
MLMGWHIHLLIPAAELFMLLFLLAVEVNSWRETVGLNEPWEAADNAHGCIAG